MVLVGDNWITIRDLQDVSNVIREYYNRDLADELDKLIPVHTDAEYYDLECELRDMNDEISELEDECSFLESENERLEEEIEKLENELENQMS
jgi:predicted  nucleic acid-binding Zn-ribbon protein